MTIKREAGYHEACHAVLAERSRFHRLVGPVNLAAYGQGEIYISLSKQKLSAAGKTPTAAAAQDPEVARDLALILVAGYIGEQIAATFDNSIVPNLDCAVPDHELARQQLSAAGLSEDLANFEVEAHDLLKAEWSRVQVVADFLLQKISVEPEDILPLLT
jgi:hypothetical protein